VGNAVEVAEAVETLKGGSTLLTTLSLSKGGGPADLATVTFALASRMLLLGKLAKTEKQAVSLLRQAITSGAAVTKFREMVKRQGGDERIVDDYSRLPQARYRISVPSPKAGWVKAIDTYRVGLLAVELGAGRKQLTDPIDHAVGFLIHKKVGQKVAAGEALATVLANDDEQGREVAQQLQQCFSLSRQPARPPRKILGELQ
jgi:pyrimidine-nucleoside phosphorylase